MRHSDYITFFKDIATDHPDILHSDQEMHFARVVLNRDPLIGSTNQLSEFLNNLGNDLRYPCMILIAYKGDFADNRSDNKRKRIDGSFVIMDRLEKSGDHDGEEVPI